MRRNALVRMAALLLAVSCLMPDFAYAAAPETSQTMASSCFDICSAHVSAFGGGKIAIAFLVRGMQVMDKIGAESIVLYESTDQAKWSQVKTFDGSVYLGMIGEDADSHDGTVTYYGVAGRYYKAYVCVYAQKGTGAESRYIWTSVQRAN